jgi:hypothetical protein
MSKKTIIIAIIVIVLATVGWMYFSSKNNAGSGTTSGTSLGSLFPFFPSGTGSSGSTPNDGTTSQGGDTGTTGATTDTSLFKKITDRRVGGYYVMPLVELAAAKNTTLATATTSTSMLSTATTSAPTQMLRFLEQGTGNVFEIAPDGTHERKLSSTTILRAKDALFLDNGESLVIRYIKNDNKTIATYLGKILPGELGAAGKLQGDFLPDNIGDVAIAPDGKSIVYITPSGTGVTGITAKADGSAKKQVFSSPFTEWLLEWTGAGIGAITKAASGIDSHSYTIDAKGEFRKVLGGIEGMTQKTSPSGKYALYNKSNKDGTDLFVRTFKTGTDSDTGLATLPEKCAWSLDELTVFCAVPEALSKDAYPDSWYQGIFHGVDTIWKIDVASGTTTQLSIGNKEGSDMTNLFTSRENNVLYFIDKNTGALWSFTLKS